MWFLYQSKQDIQKFIDKFGQENYDKFVKNKQRLSSKGQSADILYYVKNYDVEQLEKFLYDIENKVVKDSSGKTKNNAVKVTENEYYTVYDILDWQTSMNMGDGTEWCISGRYQTDGKVEPSQAKQFFDKYKQQYDVKFYLFCMPKNPSLQKYCIVVYDKDNYEVWDSYDKSLGENPPSQIPIMKQFKILPIENYPESLDIVDARLLQLGQLEDYNKKFRSLFNYSQGDWWLSTPANEYDVLCVLSDTYSTVQDRIPSVSCIVRPVLEIKNLQQSGFKVGDKFKFGRVPFKIISNTMAFCLQDIGECCFREDQEAEDIIDYEESDVKKYVDEWFFDALSNQ